MIATDKKQEVIRGMQFLAGRCDGNEVLKRFPEKFQERVVIEPNGCWRWTGKLNPVSGYGSFYVSGDRYHPAHRYAYEFIFGPITDGLEPDHLCRNRWCACPFHMEPVTHRENVRRSTSPVAKQMAQTHCIRGHEFNKENTLIKKSRKKQCRICDRESKITKRRSAGIGPPLLRGSRTHCPSGHPYDERHGYLNPKGSWACRTCANQAKKRKRRMKAK